MDTLFNNVDHLTTAVASTITNEIPLMNMPKTDGINNMKPITTAGVLNLKSRLGISSPLSKILQGIEIGGFILRN